MPPYFNLLNLIAMKLSKQQKRDKLNKLLVKTLLVVLSTAVIVFFMPRDKGFNFNYDIGKPWRYGQLIATFKFPIYKDDSIVRREQDSLMLRFQPYYNMDESVRLEMQKRLKSLQAKPGYASVHQQYVKHISQMLDSVYTHGVVSTEEFARMTKREGSMVRIVVGNTAIAESADRLYSMRSAYEYIMGYDTVNYSRSVLQSYNIVELLAPNIIYDKDKSQVEAEALKATVSGANGMVQSGQKIIDRGDLVTEETYRILKSYEKESQKYNTEEEKVSYVLIGQIVFVGIVLMILVFYLSLFRKDYLENVRCSILSFSLIVFFSVVASLMMSRNMLNVFMLPCCMVPIVIRVFLDSRTAFMFHTAMVVIISVILNHPYEFILLQLVTGMIAIQSLRELSQRSQIIKTAFIITFGYAVLYAAYELAIENDPASIDISMFIFFVINGILLLFTYPLLWLFEKMYNFVSDVTLVELSNINNPLLMRLSEVAPGTFQHSMQVANLASDVAKSIGARAQLVRTGALYHDIGKMERPVFFTENQAGGNPHTHLTPMKSAEVIIAHVINGLSLADKHHLPELIKGFISTHHGLGKTKYFYVTYKNEHPNEEVDESLFTYPGPNPTSKEEAILMMADSVEAASRSLSEYTEDSISNLVDRIVDGQVAEGYFNECEITFHEIATAKSVFKERLKVIYHTRISYPELK